jgi:hypothetical protein
VDQDHRGRAREDRELEDLARMDEGCGQGPDRDDVEAEDLVLAVER